MTTGEKWLIYAYTYLLGGLEHEFYFSIIDGIILPIDELIFFKMGKTTNQSKIGEYEWNTIWQW